MRRTNIEGWGAEMARAARYAVKPRQAPAYKVAQRRQSRAYYRLRERIDRHYLNDRNASPEGLALPRRLSKWRPQHGARVRELYPELSDTVREIDRLAAQRLEMRRNPSEVPPSPYKRSTLPADPIARAAERRRREIEGMRRLRLRRKYGHENFDLIGL